jgi:bacterioferritin-associated ferredoxin
MIVCHCHRVSDRTVRAVIAAGAKTEDDVAKVCGAGSCCGGCVPSVTELLEETRGPRRLPILISAA